MQYNPKIKLDDVVTGYVIASVEHHKNNKTEAAKALGISLKTIYSVLKRKDVFHKYIASGYEGRVSKRGNL